MENIRLVIWDLDETFWKGTLSEGYVEIPTNHKKIIIELTNRGIVNSICSKNEKDEVKAILEKEGLWEYFVFPKIAWKSKGLAIKEIVDDIKLRPETILFIDDNKTNLGEAKYYIPDINVAGPEVISGILDDPRFNGKDDINHIRLKQYQVLEKKKRDAGTYDSNKDFLIQSAICVKIHEENILEKLDRLYELNQRTNQLNFTKKRLEKEEIKQLIEDESYNVGYVEVEDRYGDYGIVGFYALKDNKLSQFLFSCRTIGLGVEQWVYSYLNFPDIDILGSVACELDIETVPDWINISDNKEVADVSVDKDLRILLIGGCDLEQTAFYLEQSKIPFDTQFNYVVNKLYDGHPDSSVVIRQSVEYDENQKNKIIEMCDFYDNDSFNCKLFEKKYDVVVYSPLIDMSIGIWTMKNSPNIKVVYGNRDFENITNHGYLPKDKLSEFKKNFEWLGGISPEELYDNLSWIRKKMGSDVCLIVLNGGECDISHPYEPKRYLVHKEMNKVIKKFCDVYENTYLLDVSSLVKNENCYTDNIRHYTRNVYYNIAKDIIEILDRNGYIKANKIHEIDRKGKIDYKKSIKRVLRKIGLLNLAYKIRGN